MERKKKQRLQKHKSLKNSVNSKVAPNAFLLYLSKKSSSYRDIHNAGKGDDENRVKESEKVSLGGEGGEEEADEGDAADVGGDHGEQAEEQLHYSSHSLTYSNPSF